MRKSLWLGGFVKPPWLPNWRHCRTVREKQPDDTGDLLCDVLREFASEERDRFFVLLVFEIARRQEMYGYNPPQPKKPTHQLSCAVCGWKVDVEYGQPWPTCCGNKVGPSWWTAEGKVSDNALKPDEEQP